MARGNRCGPRRRGRRFLRHMKCRSSVPARLKSRPSGLTSGTSSSVMPSRRRRTSSAGTLHARVADRRLGAAVDPLGVLERGVARVCAHQALGERQQRVGRRPFARVYAADHRDRAAGALADAQEVDLAPLVRAVRQYARRAHVWVRARQRCQPVGERAGGEVAGRGRDALGRDRAELRPQLIGALEALDGEAARAEVLRGTVGRVGGHEPAFRRRGRSPTGRPPAARRPLAALPAPRACPRS